MFFILEKNFFFQENTSWESNQTKPTELKLKKWAEGVYRLSATQKVPHKKYLTKSTSQKVPLKKYLSKSTSQVVVKERILQYSMDIWWTVKIVYLDIPSYFLEICHAPQ